MLKKRKEITDEDFYALKIGTMWRYFKGESFAFWMICAYLLFEYFRPQSIYPVIDILPWTQIFIIGAFLGCFLDKSVGWSKSISNKLIVSFFIVILASSVLAYYPSVSFNSLINIYQWVIIYFLIINIVNSERRIFIFICIFLLASFKLSMSLAITWGQRGFSFTSWGLSGPPGFFQNSGELSIQMLIYWPIALAFIKDLQKYTNKLKYAFLMLMPITAIMVILGASSRGAQLALIVQLLVMYHRTIFRPKVLFLASTLFLMLWTILPDEQKSRFEQIGEDKSSIQRVLYWENGLEMLNEHPFFGVGYYNYIPYYQMHYPEDMLYSIAQLPHNIFIQVGTDSGYIGLFIYLCLMLFCFNSVRKANRDNERECQIFGSLPNALSYGLLGFIVAGQFVSVVYYPFFWIQIALIVCVCRRKNTDRRGAHRKNYSL